MSRSRHPITKLDKFDQQYAAGGQPASKPKQYRDIGRDKKRQKQANKWSVAETEFA